jgi:hypothetical protein
MVQAAVLQREVVSAWHYLVALSCALYVPASGQHLDLDFGDR